MHDEFERRIALIEDDVARGNDYALAHGAHLCDIYQRPLPPWLYIEILARLPTSDNLPKAVARRRRGDVKHWQRGRHIEAAANRGSSLDDAYADASEAFDGTPFAGVAETMKQSYRKYKDLPADYRPTPGDFLLFMQDYDPFNKTVPTAARVARSRS